MPVNKKQLYVHDDALHGKVAGVFLALAYDF